MHKHLLSTLLLVLTSTLLPAQENQELFKRLRGVTDGKGYFYNVDGREITNHTQAVAFSESAVRKLTRKYNVSNKTPLQRVEGLPFDCLYAVRSEEVAPGVNQNISNYFFKDKHNTIGTLAFSYGKERDKAFEESFLQMVYESAIPKSVVAPREIDSIEFAGRYIDLGRACHWMGANNVQCPALGQINWGLHKDMEGARDHVAMQMAINKATKGIKLKADEEVDVVFEGQDTKARKLVLDITGVTSLLVGMSGGKTLTVFYVAAPVRGYNVSCVMSTWNNDRHSAAGLPPLIEEVMKIKN